MIFCLYVCQIRLRSQNRLNQERFREKASARLYTGAEAAEITANRAQQSDKVAGKQLMRELTPNDDDDNEIIMPTTPPGLARKSQRGSTITLALRTPERLHSGPDLAPNVSSARETEPAWQLPTARHRDA
jgi:hypothetical protein